MPVNTLASRVEQPISVNERSHGCRDVEQFADAANNSNNHNKSSSPSTNHLRSTRGRNDPMNIWPAVREKDSHAYEHWRSGWFDEDDDRKMSKYSPANLWNKMRLYPSRKHTKVPLSQYTESQRQRRPRLDSNARQATGAAGPHLSPPASHTGSGLL
jgi:murein L,D-transpeptidase YafK